VRQMQAVWEQDWAQTERGRKEAKKAEKTDRKNSKELAAAS
jgi:hypothetical protein